MRKAKAKRGRTGLRVTAREQTKLLTHTLLDHHNRRPYGSWPEWVAVPEIEAKGAGGQRLDVLAVRRSYRNPEVRGCEVKVTRSDFNKDVDTGKYRGYLAVCNTLYFCVPSGLVKKHEVPHDAGLMVWSGRKWSVIKRAPVHPGTNFTWQTMLGVAMKAVDRVHQTTEQQVRDFHSIRKIVTAPDFDPYSAETEEQLVHWAANRAGMVLSQRLASSPEANSLSLQIVRSLHETPALAAHCYGADVPDVHDWQDTDARTLAQVLGNLRRLDRILDEMKRLGYIGTYLSNLSQRHDWENSSRRVDDAVLAADDDAHRGR